MRQAGHAIHPEQVQLTASKINLLGFVVEGGTLRLNEDKLQAITDCTPPHDVKSLQ